ncbi:hypothetical protein HZ326_18406, partial [Fusarium oxysporum f. sp. albedinis]
MGSPQSIVGFEDLIEERSRLKLPRKTVRYGYSEQPLSALSAVIGMVWYGLVWGVKPNHTRCLHNNRYGITGKTNNTSKDAKT